VTSRRPRLRPLSYLWPLVLLGFAGGGSALAAQVNAKSRLYGRVTTAPGEVVEGFLRWDRNEGSWADILEGSKALPEENVAEAARLGVRTPEDRERSIVYAGVRIVWEEDDDYPRSAGSGIRFGHLRSLTALEGDSVQLDLKGGVRVVLRGSSTDLGAGFRGLRVLLPGGGATELSWADLTRVDFLPAPDGVADRPGPVEGRLHGTVHDRRGRSFTGFVAWDRDEGFPDDVLDGEDEAGDRREILFRDVARIEQASRGAARIVLRDGRTLLLTGTNDVDRDNRGIQISDPSLGEVTLAWDDFTRFEAHLPAREVTYASFAGATPLRGTVTTRAGEAHRGRIRWDNDEAWSWELLDGRAEGAEMSIELGLVRRIEKVTSGSVRVVLLDGRSFELEGSNDVGEGNKGVFVERADGSRVGVRWEDFETLELESVR